jgi:alpha-galactosidase
VEIWTRALSAGALAVGVFNRSAQSKSVTLDWAELGLKTPKLMRDVWRAADLGPSQQPITRDIPPHGVVLLRVSGIEP